MKPNQCIALLILMMVPLSIHAQRNPSINLSSVSDPNERAKRIVQKILEVDGRSSVSIKVKEDKNIKNALAWMEGPTRIIKYNPDFLSKFGADAQSKTATIALFAHEVGHHVQNLLGISDKVHRAQQGASKSRANALSVRLELQADCFAGVWGHRADAAKNIIEPGEIEQALNAASAIGDDRLQQQTQGRIVPESFTHGSSEQRMRWFKRGIDSGDLRQCDTFKAASL